MTILIVDDSRDEQELLSTRLRAAGYGSLMVADSAEAAFGILGLDRAGQRTEKEPCVSIGGLSVRSDRDWRGVGLVLYQPDSSFSTGVRLVWLVMRESASVGFST